MGTVTISRNFTDKQNYYRSYISSNQIFYHEMQNSRQSLGNEQRGREGVLIDILLQSAHV